MKPVYALESFPVEGEASIFLAGPTPRDKSVESWRPEALRILESLGYKGHVYIPEPRSGDWSKSYTAQVQWEETALNRADVILFWIPRDMKTMPGLTTNDEWGVWKDSGKVVLGTTPDAVHVSYQKHYANEYKIPIGNDLTETVSLAVARINELGPSLRENGDLAVPLYIWNNPSYQVWYHNQKIAGNRVDDAKVRFTLWVGPQKKSLFLWCLWAKVWIGSENRHKENEIMLSRLDISSVVLHGPVHVGNLGETEIILVREFRVPANNPTGFVWECPGGSSLKKGKPPQQVASEEVKEETGKEIRPSRFQTHGPRQLASTLSIHRSHLFSVELSPGEVEWFRQEAGKVHGNIEDTERTYIEVKTLKQCLDEGTVDWSMLGMIQKAILESADLV